MKKQRYIVEIEMPDGDFIPAGWLKDLIQAVCDVEDESRQKVTVQETTLTSNLDEAAEDASIKKFPDEIDLDGDMDAEIWYKQHMKYWRVGFKDGFKAGAEWMAGQSFPRWRNIDEEKPERGEDCACITVTVNGHIKYSNFEEGPWSWDDKADSDWFETEAFMGYNDYGDKEYHTCSHWMPWDEFIGVLERQFKK